MNAMTRQKAGLAQRLSRGLSRAGAIAAGVVMLASAGAATAKDIRYAFGFPTSFATYPSIVRYAEQIKKDAGLDVKIFAESLLKPSEMMAGLRDGLADVGWDAMPYNPTEFSEGALIAELSMLITAGETPDVPGAAMTGAVLEYVMLNCPDCLAQFKKQNVVFLSGTGTTPYYLICNKPVLTLADVKGKRIRTAAGNFERWASSVGATAVPMPGNETYDALGQGVLDCTSNDLSQLIGQRLVDVGKKVTVGVPGGVYGGSAIADWNRNTWKSLTPQQRAAVFKASARFSADTVKAFFDATDKSVADAKKRGADVRDAAPDLKAATAAFVEADKAVIIKQYTEKNKLNNVAAKVATASRLIEKWKKLTMRTPADVDVLEKLYWTEVYSKINLATYGLD
jgi:TRAP-type C4-dicarboxylate transport system substrate-binding protein